MTNTGARKGLLLAAVACHLIGLLGSSNAQGDACSVPRPGNCLPISNCAIVQEIVRTQGVQSREAQQYLNDGSCGYEGFLPKVCCPSSVTEDPDQPYPNPLALLPNSCGIDYSNKIIGGENTELDEFPWMAVIEYDTDRGVQTGCGGVLISRRYVLTAAHCIRAAPSNWRLARVRLGEYNLRTDPDCQDDGAGGQHCADPVTVVAVERQIVHESYMQPQRLWNDVALLRLARDVAFGQYVQPICLPTSAAAERNYWSAGWGQVERRASSDVKLKVSVPHFDGVQCARIYAAKGIVLGDGQLCAGGVAGKDTCKGDSGGPLMKQIQPAGGLNRWVVDGIVSFGHSPCGLPGWPAVYTRVYNYVPWILSKLRP